MNCEWPRIPTPPHQDDSPVPSSQSAELSWQACCAKGDEGIASLDGWNIHSFTPISSVNDGQVVIKVAAYDPAITLSMIPRPPRASAEAWVEYFMAEHDRSVCAGHYFWFADYNGFCKRDLLELANKSVPLRYAVAGYSALLYSAHYRDHRARVLALTYYSEALRCVNETIASYPPGNMIEPSASTDDSIFAMLAAVLQLTTFEVRLSSSSVLTVAFPRRSGQNVSTCSRRNAFITNIFRPSNVL